MSRLRRAVEARRISREQYRKSIHYALDHAMSQSERNELTLMATEQGASI